MSGKSTSRINPSAAAWIAVTMGDPGGVGPEIILKSLSALKPGGAPVLVMGTPSVFHEASRRFRLPVSFVPVSTEVSLPVPERGRFYFYDTSAGLSGRLRHRFYPGRTCKTNAQHAWCALEQASRLACTGKVAAIVTAPVNKTAMRRVSPGFSGHTEFLTAEAGVRKMAMFFFSERLKVTLVTIHVALQDVSRLLKARDITEKIELTHTFLVQKLRIKKPRLAVCALNPHGRETGKGEEQKQIAPAVRRARTRGIQVQGPLPADQLFHDAWQGRFDAVVSMYHDQGLGPFKMTAFDTGVNVTLGLPYVRTSPDHGTAFDIAWRGKAREHSFSSALQLARRLTGRSE